MSFFLTQYRFSSCKLSLLMFYSLVICAAMHFYGYEGPEDRHWFHPRWYKLEATIAWIKDQEPNVWEIMD